MTKEICTLNFEAVPLTYYITFDKSLSSFSFSPGIGNQFAPSFTIHVDEKELFTNDRVPDSIWEEAKQKVNLILTTGFYKDL
jgi:hypothetical protein